MAVSKTVKIDGQEVHFKASAAVPRMYRLKFGRDIYKDMSTLYETASTEDDNDIESLEIFENVAYIFAKHADPDEVPDSPDEWLEQFSMFSIYQVLPELISLWSINTRETSEGKKSSTRRAGK